MALKYAPQTAFNWSGNWCNSDDGIRDVVKPGAGDICFLTVNSGDCTLDEDSATLGGLSMAGYPNGRTFAFGAFDIDVDSAVILDGTITSTSGILYVSGAFTKAAGMAALPSTLTVELDGSGDVTCNAITGGKLTINTSGTITLGDDNFWANWTIRGAGTFDYDSNDLAIVGNINEGGSVALANQGTTFITGTATACKFSDATANRLISDLNVTGTMTIVSGSFFRLYGITIGSTGTITDGGGTGFLAIHEPTDNFWTQNASGVVSCLTRLFSTSGTPSTGAAMILSGELLITQGDFIADGDITITAEDLNMTGGLGDCSLDMVSFALSSVNVTVGASANAVTLDLGTGSHTITGTIADGGSGGTHTLILDKSIIDLSSGILNGNDITITTLSNNYATIIEGTILNVTIASGLGIDATNSVTNGGGNNPKVYFSFIRPGFSDNIINIGGNILSVNTKISNSNNAPTLLTSYSPSSHLISTNNNYTKNCVLGGLPLSISLHKNINTNPSVNNDVDIYYTFDIIEYLSIDDAEDLNTAQFPSAKSFMLNGNKLYASKINNFYYFKISDTRETAIPTRNIVLNGIPMATGINNELILRKTNYTINNLADPSSDMIDFIEFNMGGTPMQAGRIENKYYLIVTPVTVESGLP